jgi:hypothetical protein
VQHGKIDMPALPKVSAVNPCPFCGVIADVPHETQEGCIAALHTEIGRMRGLLANLKPAGVCLTVDEQDQAPPAAIRLALD